MHDQDTLRVLLIEDSAADAELLLRELRSLNRRIDHRRVATQSTLVDALREFAPEIILSDYTMPGFGGRDALEIVIERAPGTPFVFVSGTIGEERAIEALQRGAYDYVLKDNLRRLPSAVDRALRLARERLEREEIQRALRTSEERFRSLIETSRDWIWESDPDLRVRYSNDALAHILGYAPDEIAGRPVIELLVAQDRQEVQERIPVLIRERRGWHRWRLRWLHRNGSCRVLESTGGPYFDEDGTLAGFRGIDHDITEHLEQQTKIRQLARIHAVLGALGTAVLRNSDRDGLLHNACRIAVEQGGFMVAGVSSRGPDDALHLVSLSGARSVMESLVPTGSIKLSPGGEFEHLCMRALRLGTVEAVENFNDSTVPRPYRELMAEVGICSGICLPIGSQPWGVLSLYSDVPRRFDEEEIALLRRVADEIDHGVDFIAKSERLEFLAYHNPVTGLPNRPGFDERLRRLLGQGAVSVVAVDIQRFGRINNSRGRLFGDALLREIGLHLHRLEIPDLIVGHADADVFLLAYPASGDLEEECERLEMLLQRAEQDGITVHEEILHVGLRGGLALSPVHGLDSETLERNAQAALDEAKEQRQRLSCYSDRLSHRESRRIELERSLRRALEQRQFELYYQPKFDAQTRALSGAEALLRWTHPTEGMISPVEFIPILEETGLIVQVGQWVMAEALGTADRWRESWPGFRIAVNVSAYEMRHPRFLERCRVLLEPYAGDPPLDIEITESVLMDDIDHSVEVLAALRSLGCRVAIDDFGTGYSSLNYLVRLPIDLIKIDRSFVSMLTHSPETVTLVSNMMGLSHSLGLLVVAEGVEDEEQAKLLRLLRCDVLQGYLLGRPMPASALEQQVLGNAGR